MPLSQVKHCAAGGLQQAILRPQAPSGAGIWRALYTLETADYEDHHPTSINHDGAAGANGLR
jgi:hypothetical protein